MFDEDDYTYEAILEKMLSTVPDTIDKREGSIIYDALSPAAKEFVRLYLWLKNAMDLVFVDTSVGEYLDRLCNQVGITRYSATPAIKRGNFYDIDGNLMNVDISSRYTCGDLYWIVTEKISDGVFQVACETNGIDGNNVTGNLIPVDYINDLSVATLTDLLIPGEDEESDDELRARYFEQTSEKAFAGNIVDYKNKTKEISGVGAVKVTPVFNGPGTVELTILNSNYNKASDLLIQNVQNQICPDYSAEGIGLAPIGHAVTVDTVTEIDIDISAKVITVEGVEPSSLKTEIIKEINKYLLELRKEWEDSTSLIVRKSRIESLILNVDNVIDISDVTINNGTSNILLQKFEIPILKEVVIT